MKFKIAVLVVTIMFSALSSQNARIDSLRQEMNQAEGKKRVQLMNSLAGAYRHIDLGMMRNISLEALELAKEQDLTDELIHAYNNLGRASFYNNELAVAEEYFIKALAVAEKLQNEKTIAYVNNNLSLIHWSFGDYGKALEYNERSYNTTQKINDETGMLNAKINAGLITMEMGNYHKAIQIFDECLEESIRLKDMTREVSALNYLGQCYLYLGSYDKSLEFMTKSLEICQQNNLETELAQVYNNFGIVHFELENFEQALEYNYSALEMFEKLGDELNAAKSLNNIGISYFRLKNYDKSLQYHDLALQKRRQMGSGKEIANSLSNIGQVYESRQQYQKALEYYLESWDLNQKSDNIWNAANNANNIGKVYLGLNNFPQAEKYLEIASQLADEIAAKKLQMENYLHYYRLNRNRDNFSEALDYYILYTTMKDSIFSQESKEKIAEINAKYQLDKIENENQILKKDLKITKTRQNLYIVSVASLILVIVLFSFYTVQRTRTNRKLEDTNQQLHLAKNLAEKQSEQLALINKMLRHDLLNNFAAIISGINLFKADNDIQILDEIRSKCYNSISIIKNAKEITLGSYQQNDLQKISLQDILQKVSDEYHELKIGEIEPAHVYANEKILSVFENIINNAKLHGKADIVEITAKNVRDFCEIKISNNGNPIPHELFDKIFEENFSYGNSGQTGMGLFLVRQTIENFGGSVYVEEKHPRGVSFVINLQKAD